MQINSNLLNSVLSNSLFVLVIYLAWFWIFVLFFYLLIGCPKVNFGPLSRYNLTNPMLITVFYFIYDQNIIGVGIKGFETTELVLHLGRMTLWVKMLQQESERSWLPARHSVGLKRLPVTFE